jgi:KDO2-lipid IV(A) lauroyltransferase
MAHRPKHVLEYIAMRAIDALVNVLPYRGALALGWGLAWLGFHVVRWRVAEAERRIREVLGPGPSHAEIRGIAWRAFRGFIFCVVDTLRVPRMTPDWIRRHIDVGEIPRFSAAAAGGGAVIVTPHLGSWEMAGVVTHMMGIPLFYIVGKQKNPLTDAHANRRRGLTGIETIPRDGPALRKTLKNLKEGRMLAFMTDLRSKTPGVKATFLGHEANLVAGMGMFARMAGVPIIPTVAVRIGWTRHRIRVFDPIRPDPALDRDADISRMTQEVMNVFSRAILDAPDHYFWFNKRWVLEPLDPAETATPPSPPHGT